VVGGKQGVMYEGDKPRLTHTNSANASVVEFLDV